MHRDLKCSNVLVSNQNVVKLADFGLARDLTVAAVRPNGGQAGCVVLLAKLSIVVTSSPCRQLRLTTDGALLSGRSIRMPHRASARGAVFVVTGDGDVLQTPGAPHLQKPNIRASS